MKSLESTYFVQCYPLSDLLAALGVKHVDYFSLDVQGAELPILKTVDFTAVRIDVIIMEVADNSPAVRKQMAEDMRRLFNRTGLYREGKVPGNNDMMFERIDLA